MRYLLLILCIWSSVSVFTYTEVFAPSKSRYTSPQIEQLLDEYIASWFDNIML